MQAFVDLEYGQIYGSTRRDMIPVEIGMVLSEDGSGPAFESRKFCMDCDLVMRKNIVDSLGNTVGLAERVANSARNEHQKPYDPEFRLDRADKDACRRIAYRSFGLLNRYLSDVFGEYKPSRLVFFSRSQDLFILRRAGVDLTEYDILDLQEEVSRALGMTNMISLDRISRLIGFKTNWRYIRSDHFTYDVPPYCRNFVKPHKAVGDAARIFLLYKEFYEKNGESIFRQTATSFGDDYSGSS
ncbi:MAG TPA: hypothetical protein VMC84_13700 [Methanocella sp.]|uniref:hypothetical protein n=1 Tax=Methanocella sp. TaxID=2052833 RepID=UPI002B5D71BE|nr:hypothetical protein [Methanocella sp.]HTY92225.1 hypothetical protein [Methanocella sp.]